MTNGREELIDVLENTRTLLALPGNDYSWSSWPGSKEAITEIDSLINQLKTGQMPDRQQMTVLFAVTGPIQEVSLSSGWGEVFLKVADRFDLAIEKL